MPEDAPTLYEPRMAIAFWDRGKLLESWGDSETKVGEDFEAALILMPDLPNAVVPIGDRDLKGLGFAAGCVVMGASVDRFPSAAQKCAVWR